MPLFPEELPVSPEIESVQVIEQMLGKVNGFVDNIDLALDILEIERHRYSNNCQTWAPEHLDDDGCFGIYNDKVVYGQPEDPQRAQLPMVLFGTSCGGSGWVDGFVVAQLALALKEWAQRTETPFEDLNMNAPGKWHPWTWETRFYRKHAILIGRWFAKKGLLIPGTFDNRFILEFANIIVDWWQRCLNGVKRIDYDNTTFQIKKPGLHWTLQWKRTMWPGGYVWKWHSNPSYSVERSSLFEKLADAERSLQYPPPNHLKEPYQGNCRLSPRPFPTWESRAACVGGLDRYESRFVPHSNHLPEVLKKPKNLVLTVTFPPGQETTVEALQTVIEAMGGTVSK